MWRMLCSQCLKQINTSLHLHRNTTENMKQLGQLLWESKTQLEKKRKEHRLLARRQVFPKQMFISQSTCFYLLLRL